MPWASDSRRLLALAERRLFFVGGAPRSGTTWLQQMLDAHPQVCCRGEGLFLHHLAVPFERAMQDRTKVITDKNRDLFTHTGGFPLPNPAGVEHLVGTAILLGLDQYGVGPDVLAVGEKTPENVFFFPRLRALFPQAAFVAIARDPRDVLSSAWHFFGRTQNYPLDQFVAAALPSMVAGARAMLEFTAAAPDCSRLVTYEALRANPAPVLHMLFDLLGVDTDAPVIADVLARTDFTQATGRSAGTVEEGSFNRAGVVGDWRNTLTPQVNRTILDALGWMFPLCGWAPD